MSLVQLIVALGVVGLLLWLINTYIPMDAKIKKIINVSAIVIIVLWLLYAVGALGAVNQIQVPHF
jgi:hypothetical protein